MKAIKNSNEDLYNMISNENANWQRIIYDKLGVLLLFNKYPILFSNCGYIDLDNDVEYHYQYSNDLTDYVEITSIEDIIDYISRMPSYNTYLKDISFGEFNKSELFWAIHDRVIFAPQNLALSKEQGKPVYALYSINETNEEIILDMAVIDYNMACIGLPKGYSLDETIKIFLTEINACSKDIGEPTYKYRIENQVLVPNTYEKLMKKLESNAEFSWLMGK